MPLMGRVAGVRAVKIKFDDGREIHINFIEMLDVPGSRRFKVGERYSFNYSKNLTTSNFLLVVTISFRMRMMKNKRTSIAACAEQG